jgi:GDP-L-fucose synthase
MKILITGGTGFIGKNLKEQLSADYEIFASTSKELNLLDSEKVLSYLKKNKFDVVLHCATWNATSNSKKDTSKVLENNLRMYFNIARHQNLYNKMIYYGSGAEFSREHWKPKMTEDYFDKYVPTDQYGFSKYIMCKHAEKSENIYNLRLFGVFGKYEDWKIRFISIAICKVIWDLPITIKQNVYFDYLYIDDLVKITKWFIENNPKYHTYNICSGEVHDLKSLANMVLDISNKNLPMLVKNKEFGKEYSGNNSRLLSEIGRYTFRDMDDCISELYDWYSDHKPEINKKFLLVNR